MHDSSAPPTLLDRLTRFDTQQAGDARETREVKQTKGRPLDDLDSVPGHPPVLNELINHGDIESVYLQANSAADHDHYRPTDFAITTVNVPDRLDLREARDRAEEEYKRPGLLSFDRYLLGLWIRRIFWLTLLSFIGFWGYKTLLPIREELRPESISARLTQRAGMPISVTDVTYRMTPSPRLVLQGVRVGDELRLDEVAVRLNWKDTWSALVGGNWSLGEATVSPVRLNASQIWTLLNRTDNLSKAMPDPMSVLRFESIEVADVPLLKGHYELVLRRSSPNAQAFGPVLISQLDADSLFKLSVKRSPAADGSARFSFQFDASNWKLPFGPGSRWSEVVASGYFSPTLFEVESYMLAGVYGVMRGTAYAASDVQWAVTGFARGTGMDVEAMVAGAAKMPRTPAGEKADAALIPFTGTASVDLALVGQGETLEEALAQGVAGGPIQVKGASIRGVNLGYAAAHGGSDRGLAGGLTRFSDFDALLLGGANGITLRDIVARAGAMTTRGEISLTPDATLKGAVRVDLGLTRAQAPISLKVQGPILSPQFVR